MTPDRRPLDRERTERLERLADLFVEIDDRIAREAATAERHKDEEEAPLTD